LVATTLQVPGSPLRTAADPEALLPAPAYALADDPSPAVQQLDPTDASPSPPTAAQPTPSVPDGASTGYLGQPTTGRAVSTTVPETTAPAAPLGPSGASAPTAMEPGTPGGLPNWAPPAGYLPPLFGSLDPFGAPPPFPPPLMPPIVPPPLVVIQVAAPVPIAAGAAPVVSLTTNLPPLTGLVGVPCATALGATCTVSPALTGLFTVTGSMSYTVSATGPAGTIAGGIPAIFIPTTRGVEAFACAAVTAQLQTTCRGSTVGNALQAGTVLVRFALRGGTTGDVVGTISGPGPLRTATSTATATSTPTPTAVPTPVPVVPCRDLRTLRELAGRLQTVTNTRTGQTVEYLVIGDGARSNQLLVFFNGTGQIVPDWPTQMITNSSTSPLITTTANYSPNEDSTHSLCHDYRLVFFDYPGVGLSPATTGVTFDQIANDVDAVLADVGQRYQIPTNNVSAIGWSNGTEAALKYSFLSPASNPSRTIDNSVLIAAKPGGGQSTQTNGNMAQCVDDAFNVLVEPSTSPPLRDKLQENNYRLLYPFQGQQPYNGPSSGCTVDINTTTNTVVLSVTPGPCGVGSLCLSTEAEFAANRQTFPWSLTGGISQAVLVNERDRGSDWDTAYCPTAGPNFTSLGCTSIPSSPPLISATNGGVCQTVSPPGLPNQPISSQCVPLQIPGSVTVINGPQDLYIQYTYGAALVSGYQRQYGPQKANLVTYPGADGAGHGILLQHPKFVQDNIFTALQTAAQGPSRTSRR
jgi:pimeloyl-ACP methyl ester carboxylesterase